MATNIRGGLWGDGCTFACAGGVLCPLFYKIALCDLPGKLPLAQILPGCLAKFVTGGA